MASAQLRRLQQPGTSNESGHQVGRGGATCPNVLCRSHDVAPGAVQLSWAFVEFINVGWLAGITYGTFDGYLCLWGILDVIVGLAAIYAGYDILRGGRFGRIVGVVIAGISAVRWWFYLPAAPYLGIVMIPVAILIIYGLVVHSDFFDGSQRDFGDPV